MFLVYFRHTRSAFYGSGVRGSSLEGYGPRSCAILGDPYMAIQRPAAAPLLVLVVDDDPDTAESTAMLLERYGCDVCVALTAPEAIQHASAFRPGLVLLDLGLPDMDGYRVARAIRRMPWASNTTIVAVSGFGQEADKQRCREAGIDNHFIKPVEPAKFERLVAQLRGQGKESA